MMNPSYDSDILEWSDHQSALLRRHAAGDRINETPDWTNIAEEIESVGRAELYAVESLLVQSLIHESKCLAWPQSGEVPGWRAEARRFRGDAAARFTPSMRQRIDLASLYRRACRAVPETIDAKTPLPLPQTCPATLEQLLADL